MTIRIGGLDGNAAHDRTEAQRRDVPVLGARDRSRQPCSADIAFLGIPYGSAYSVADISNDQSTMPTALRQASDRMVRSLERYDFDVGGPLYDGQAIRAVDCGDVRADIHDLKSHVGRAEQAVRKILAAGALPIVLGGDHAIPIPVLRAFEGRGPDHARAHRPASRLAR